MRQQAQLHEEATHLGIVRQRSEQANFKCKVCGKEFSRTTTLRRHHKSVHLGLRPFYCEDCGDNTTFAQKQDLDHHTKRVHLGGAGLLKCGSCEKLFPTRSKVERHAKSMHRAPHLKLNEEVNANL